MTEDTATKKEEQIEEKKETKVSDKAPRTPRGHSGPRSGPVSSRQGRGGRPKNRRKGKPRRQRVRSEFDHRVVDIRRVARVMAGGRRFSFSATLIAGDRKGRIGVGIGKALDTASAIDKALRSAKREMKQLNLTKDMSLPHEVEASYASAHVSIFPTPGKGGITAGGAARTVLELAGVRDVGAKILSRSKNKLNNARATVLALARLQKPKSGEAPKKPVSQSSESKAKK